MLKILSTLLIPFAIFYISCSNDGIKDKSAEYEFKNSNNEVIKTSFYSKENSVFVNVSYVNAKSPKPTFILINTQQCTSCNIQFVTLLNLKSQIDDINAIMLSNDDIKDQNADSYANDVISKNKDSIFIATKNDIASQNNAQSNENTIKDDFFKKLINDEMKIEPKDEKNPIMLLLDSNNKILKVYEGIIIQEALTKDIKQYFCKNNANVTNQNNNNAESSANAKNTNSDSNNMQSDSSQIDCTKI